jgi:hypothetical protein
VIYLKALPRADPGRRLSRVAIVRRALKGMRTRVGGVLRIDGAKVGRELVTSQQAVGRFVAAPRALESR